MSNGRPESESVQEAAAASAVVDPERLAALRALNILDTPADPSFDSIVEVASEVCEAPTALVSLIDSDRQWFKARVGFLPSQTTLDRSVCAHTLPRSDILVICDLTADSRTSRNPLVTGPEGIRFYAGAPLITTDGHHLGALCVIDTKPRPDGLTHRQANVLRQLARQAVSQIELRRLLAQRDDMVEHLRAARDEAAEDRRRFSLLFDNAPSFIALKRGPNHIYEKVNDAYRTIIGERDVLGKSVIEVLPEAVEQGFVDILDEVYRTGEPYSAKAVKWVPRGEPGKPQVERFLDFVYQPLLENGEIAGIFTIGYDVTDRVLQARRDQALADLGEHMRALSHPEDVTRRAAQILAEALQATRAGVGTVDAASESVLMHPNWCAPGATPVEGVFHFRDYGSFIDDLKLGRTVIVEDPATDPRTKGGAAALEALGIRVLLNIPVIDRDRFVLVAFVHFSQPRTLSAEEILFVQQVADRTQATLSRLDAEEQQRTLNQELAHRMKNSLAMVQAIATQTMRQARTMEEGREVMSQRLAALGRAQDILTGADFENSDLRAVVGAAIAPHQGPQIAIDDDGAPIRLTSQQALGLSLAIHELATNAAKYGALSQDEGTVTMSWAQRGGVFQFEWIETGGPPVTKPERKGFGSRLIERIVASYFEGEGHIDFQPAGIRFTLTGTSGPSGGKA